MNDNHSLTFLVVDDDEVDREVIRRMFTKLKLANPVVEAENGEQALAILRGVGSQPALNRPFIILLDINMPIMDGHEFLQRIRADGELQDAIVFILSTSDAAPDRLKAQEASVSGYILKSALLNETPEQSFLELILGAQHHQRVIERTR